MKFRRQFFTALLASSMSFGVMATAVRAETLEQAVQATLEGHPSITTARTGSEMAVQQRREERSGYYPEVSVSGSAGRIYGDNATSRGFVTTRGAAYSNYWDGSVTARQMLFDGFETGNRVDSAKARKNSADMNVLDVEERLAFSVAQAYIDLLRARKGLEMMSAHAKKVTDYEQRIKGMVDDGAADESEYQQARDIRTILDNMIAEYEGQVHSAEAYYIELTGKMPIGEMVIPGAHTDLIPETPVEAVAYAKDNHPALKSASLMTKSASYDADAEKGGLYPDVGGEVSYLKSEKEDIIGGELIDARALVRLNWDLETGGAQLARIKQKKIREKEAQSQMEELQRQLERTIHLSYAEYNTALRQKDSLNKRHELNQKLFETYNVQFDGARITLLQLMQADNQLFTTSLEKMNGEFRVLKAQFGILAAMGRLRESLGQLETTQTAAVAKPLPPGPSLTRLTTDDQK